MVLGGIRGAIAIALALSLSFEIPHWYTIQSAVYGVALDICVKFAAEGLLDLGYEVDIVEDASRGIDEKNCRETLDNLQKRGARVITTDELIGETK